MNRTAVVLAVVLLSTLSLAGLAAGQDAQLQYAAKVVCGKAPERILAPGVYFTAVNIHNATDAKTAFRWKVARALPGEASDVSRFVDMKLAPDQAMELDCPTILRSAAERSFFKGFVVIQSRVALDVVSVYSAAGSTGSVEALDVEYVPERRTTGCAGPDLITESIDQPSWDGENSRSVIKAVIKNVGNGDAAASIARVIDPTTPQSTGAPYNAIAHVPALPPGASFTAVFHLPYWVYNPDVTLEVTADYKGMVEECNEENNTRVFNDIG